MRLKVQLENVVANMHYIIAYSNLIYLHAEELGREEEEYKAWFSTCEP